MSKEMTKALLNEKQVDCFSCRWGSGDFGCAHPQKMHESVSLPGVCKLWEQAEDMNEPWYRINPPLLSKTRRCDMIWSNKTE